MHWLQKAGCCCCVAAEWLSMWHACSSSFCHSCLSAGSAYAAEPGAWRTRMVLPSVMLPK